jgi:UDP:flavonoid glycosyltransferase YjiC (YdhE family)
VRVLATTNRREPTEPLDVPPNARLVDWVSYARTMPLCDAVVCHAGHGTLARALASGTPVVACPHAGDMAENAARIRWAGAGVSLPRRFTTPVGVRLAVRRVLSEPRYRRRAEGLRDWAARNDGAATAADAVEEFAESHKNAQRAG